MNGVDALARMLPSLAIIVGALLLLRHWAQKGRGGASTPLRVVSRAGVGKGSVVAVVEVGERRLLVGAAEQGISLLAELDAEPLALTTDAADPAITPTPQTPETPETPGPSPAAPATDRQRLLEQLRQGLPASTPTSIPDRPRMAPIDRLRHMTVRTPVARHPSRPNRVQPRP